MEKGRRMTIAGLARTPEGRIGMLHDTREGTGDANGSRSVARTWTGDTWPDTAKGRKAASEASAAFNLAERDRLGLFAKSA